MLSMHDTQTVFYTISRTWLNEFDGLWLFAVSDMKSLVNFFPFSSFLQYFKRKNKFSENPSIKAFFTFVSIIFRKHINQTSSFLVLNFPSGNVMCQPTKTFSLKI